MRPAISPDGRTLVYRSGKPGEEQLYRLPVDGIDRASAEQLTRTDAGVGTWRWAPDSRRIYFITYIRNAKTPTMIHVVEGDPRVPSPQSVELHMALKQRGVPTELFMYPGSTHGIPDPRNRLVKAVSEMAWMDYYVRGKGEKFRWRDVLKTLEDANARTVTEDR